MSASAPRGRAPTAPRRAARCGDPEMPPRLTAATAVTAATTATVLPPRRRWRRRSRREGAATPSRRRHRRWRSRRCRPSQTASRAPLVGVLRSRTCRKPPRDAVRSRRDRPRPGSSHRRTSHGPTGARADVQRSKRARAVETESGAGAGFVGSARQRGSTTSRVLRAGEAKKMFDESKHRFPMDVISREKLNLQVIVTTIRKLKNVSECNFLHGMMKVLTKSRRGALARLTRRRVRTRRAAGASRTTAPRSV